MLNKYVLLSSISVTFLTMERKHFLAVKGKKKKSKKNL